MEMTQMRYVLAAAQHLNFTRAAAELNVSQPALTKAVKLLEDELGQDLFERRGKQVLMTSFGSRVLPYLKQIIETAVVIRGLAGGAELSFNKPVKVGVSSTVGANRLAKLLVSFHRHQPGIQVTMSEADPSDLKQQLLGGQLDAIVMCDMGDFGYAFNLVNLYSERYVVVLQDDHPLCRSDHIKLTDLDGEPYVDHLSCDKRDVIATACRDMGIDLSVRIQSARVDWVQAMVLAGLGIALLPESSVLAAGLTQKPLSNPSISRTVSLVTVNGPLEENTVALMSAFQSHDWA